MNNLFYFKLAKTNLKKNGKVYFPYILACICAVITFYTMDSIFLNEALENFRGGGSLKLILKFGVRIIGIISVIFLFYINSFLIKRRKKEIGIYNVLGMEKKHIARVLSIETLIVAIISFTVGILGGTIIGKLLFLVLLKLLKFDVVLSFPICLTAIGNTIILFSAIFIVILVTNLYTVKLSTPVELLRGGNKGEKEPKASVIIAFLGIVSLVTGYIIALSIESPLKSLMTFFIATILVIVGTYTTFISGSIIFLKRLKKNKRFFYKTNNFVSVSGMLYRMKQNAIGLANICVLSTAVLLTLSTTISLYVGQEDSLNIKYPLDMEIELHKDDSKNQENISSFLEEKAQLNNVKLENNVEYDTVELLGEKNENAFKSIEMDPKNIDTIKNIIFYTLDDFNKMEDKKTKLEDNEALVFSVGKKLNYDSIIINDKEFKIKEHIDKLKIINRNKNFFIEGYVVVVKDNELLKSIESSIGEDNYKQVKHKIAFDISGSNEDIMSFIGDAENVVNSIEDSEVENIYTDREEFYSINGGFIFLGCFIGLLFTMGTVLIIYYKQISEGYDDSERFKIMQKVGMSKEEVRKTINKQILMVFFLPPIVAIIHIGFAFKILVKLLSLFGLYSTSTLVIATCATIIIFLILYVIVYRLTDKAYYKIVQQ